MGVGTLHNVSFDQIGTINRFEIASNSISELYIHRVSIVQVEVRKYKLVHRVVREYSQKTSALEGVRPKWNESKLKVRELGV